MEIERYLIIQGKVCTYNTEKYECGGVRVTKATPSLKPNERAIKLSIKLPDTLFSTPELTATINVSEKCVNKKTINAETLNNISEIVEQQLGVSMTISIVDEVDDEN